MDITTIIAIAVLLEGLVEYGKTIQNAYETGEKKTAITQMITIVGGVLLAFAFRLNVFVPLGIDVNQYIGIGITGIIISRGSNYASDLIGKLTKKTVG